LQIADCDDANLLDKGKLRETASHAVETLEIGWFAENALPDDLFAGHVHRVRDAFCVWRGEQRAHFDK
jgi:hypothetical protein